MNPLALIDLKDLGGPILAMVIFGLVGILLMALGYKVFDWIMPRVDFQKELAEKNNTAVGLVIAAIIIGVALVIAAAMS